MVIQYKLDKINFGIKLYTNLHNKNNFIKSHHTFNAYSVCCITLVLHALLCDDWSQLTLANNAVAEWFDRAWLQNL